MDYNSTSPFSPGLLRFLEKGDFPFANPSSVHTEGKAARKVINQASSYIFQTFCLSAKEFDLVYHSGATEGLRTFFESAQAGDAFFYANSDHAATLAMAKILKSRGVHCKALAIDSDGNLLLDKALSDLKSFQSSNQGRAFLNYQIVHNETGVYWPVSDAVKIKKETGAFVHADATQIPGKIKSWNRLDSAIDGYTFSAHKFGALKGIGFSFIKKGFELSPILKGGGQQGGVRGGTENALGIHSIKLALEDALKTDLEEMEKFKEELEDLVLQKEDAIIVGSKAKAGRAVNTINFILKKQKADISLIQFDLAGLDVSSGSACSAGSIEPSATLTEMGLDEFAKNGIRVSLGPENLKNKKEIKERLKEVLKKL